MVWNLVSGPSSADPYLAWSQVTGFSGHAAARLPGARVPVLMRLKDAADIDSLEAQGLVNVPGVYRRGNTRFCTGHAVRATLDRLESEVEALEFGWPLAAGAIDGTLGLPPEQRRRLVVGVIDRDFAFLNGVFRRDTAGVGRGQTRITHLWDQARRPDGLWTRPRDIGYGRELRSAEIDALIARVESGEAEAALYHELGYALDADGRVPDELHGTHVADVAAGLIGAQGTAGSAKPATADGATTAELILVSLPTLERGDTTGASPAAFWLDAVRYIIERAGPGAQLVINMSVGMLAGPHDGSSLISQAIEELIEHRSRNLVIVMSAGNGRDERWSASGMLAPASAQAPGVPARLAWRLQPQDVTDSFLEVWFRPVDGALAQVEVLVTPPGPDPATGCCGVGETVQLDGAQGRPAARLTVRSLAQGGGGAMALLALAPVAGKRAAAPLGRWRVELRNLDPSREVQFDVWIQRDEPPLGLGQPLQSAFDEVSGGSVPAATTISDLACGAAPLVVGAVALQGVDERPYSARREPAAAGRGFRQINFAAPADEGVVSTGLLASGMHSGSSFRMSGTSVAAPIVSRQAANAMVAEGEYGRAQVVAVLSGQATQMSHPSGVPIIKPR